ncbi:Hypothetical protein A7982_10615 [Minicystis rosea]|nr:Hypothetical protein A7982_10615 [Minicystis rosea]
MYHAPSARTRSATRHAEVARGALMASWNDDGRSCEQERPLPSDTRVMG